MKKYVGLIYAVIMAYLLHKYITVDYGNEYVFFTNLRDVTVGYIIAYFLAMLYDINRKGK